MKKCIYIPFVAFLMCSCIWSMEDIQFLVFFKNETADTLRLYIAEGFYTDTPTAYPDTLLPADRIIKVSNYRDAPLSERLGWVYPYSEGPAIHLLGTDPEKALRDRLPADTLSVFIISADTLSKYGYDEVAKNNRLLVRYDLSISNLKRLGWTIPYPPTEQMKGMKMFVPNPK